MKKLLAILLALVMMRNLDRGNKRSHEFALWHNLTIGSRCLQLNSGYHLQCGTLSGHGRCIVHRPFPYCREGAWGYRIPVLGRCQWYYLRSRLCDRIHSGKFGVGNPLFRSEIANIFFLQAGGSVMFFVLE